ncbi:MAG TPA: hypothetical protein VNN24_06410 [Candidatus Binatus sp.]|nr:hypothetical protein [Candidatus Binatus sp.]
MIICFVASALDRADADEIYDTAIRPTLRELKIRPTRVDRIEHNDDIDDKIFALMKAADFCIADLTYARPSVYHEAGYMSGCGKPVIYISRRDHFRARDSDPHGNLRVHFDLQMKNIIGWSGPTNVFRAQLRRRVSKIIVPLLKEHRTREKQRNYETAYAGLAVSEQLGLLGRFARSMLRARGFSARRKQGLEAEHHPTRLVSVARNRAKVHQVINFIPLERFSASQVVPSWLLSFYDSPERSNVRQVDLLFVYATLRNVSDSVVRSAFSRFVPVAPFLLQKRFEPDALQLRGRPTPPKVVHVAVLPGIRSIPEFKERLRSVLRRLTFA